MQRHRPLLFALLAVALSGAVFAAWLNFRSHAVLTTDDVRIEGTFVSVSSRLADRVLAVNVREGDVVRKGDALLQIDARRHVVRREKCEAALALAKARLAETEAGFRPQEVRIAEARFHETDAAFERTKRDRERLKALAKLDGGITPADLDATEAAFRKARAERDGALADWDLKKEGARPEEKAAARAQVREAQAECDALALVGDDLTVVSPVNGAVAQKRVSAGELVDAGRPLLTLVDEDDLWLRARIEETRIGDVRVGQKVEFTIDGYPGKTFVGRVTEISPAVASAFALVSTDNAAGYFTKVMQRVPVKISLPQDAGVVFRVGMQGRIRIDVRQEVDPEVPSGALETGARR